MTKVQSGLVLIGIGVGLNILGRVAIRVMGEPQGIASSGTVFLTALGSVVIGIFGLVRLISGMLSKS